MYTLGAPIPEDSSHALSVSLPTWKANIGYEEGEEWVISKMMTGYPRFFLHHSIRKLSQGILQKFGLPDEEALLFPTIRVAKRCQDFISTNSGSEAVRIIEFVPLQSKAPSKVPSTEIWTNLCAVFYPKDLNRHAKAVWQHTGEGISSRRAEFCQRQFDEGLLVPRKSSTEQHTSSEGVIKGPRRYQRGSVDVAPKRVTQTPNCMSEGDDYSAFVEERFGRNLGAAFVQSAKLAIRKRIAGSLKENLCLEDALKHTDESGIRVKGLTADDVYLFPCGMAAIFNTHRMLLSVLGPKKSVAFGFPYVDTLKCLEKWGPGCHFYGFGSEEELDSLEKLLEDGEQIQALMCEFPSNPLLKAPNLLRVRALADKYGFAVVVDETIGNFQNINVLPLADVVVSSLTKVFSGASNVMGGCAVLNTQLPFYQLFKDFLAEDYEDNHWGEDSIFLERNSRDFVPRSDKMNVNAEVVCDLLSSHPKIKAVYYPKINDSKANYEVCRCSDGGYGALLSATFYSIDDAAIFFDALGISKGPSLGTNFSLCSPYTLLAHYTELEWAAKYGVETALIRFSAGVEDTEELVKTFQAALDALSLASLK